jgi:two-component system cell cycle sensor histidine kinase/response regulator CckA
VFAVDRELRYTFAGGVGLLDTRWVTGDVVGRPIAEVMPEQLADLLEPRYRQALEGETQSFDLHNPEDGVDYWVRIVPRFAPDGAIVGAIALSEDVTERRRGEQSLVEQVELAFTQAPIGMTLVGLDGTFIAANPALCNLLGYSADELRGLTFQQLTHPDDLEADLANLERLVGGTIPKYTLEKRYLHRDGSIVWAHLTVGIVRDADADGAPRHLIAQIQDVTEQKHVEEHLRETQRLESLGLLAGGIAHDFNNLLVGVLGNASLALAELPPDAPARRRIEQIELAASRAGSLTRQMLAYSGRGKFHVERVDLSKEAAELRQLLAGVVPEQAEIRLDLARGLPAIEGDASQVRQVVMNLLTNAAEAVADGGTVLVRTGIVAADRAYLADFRLADQLSDGDYVFLEVADDGCGMDAATAAKIFDPFFTTKFTGRGLGLAAVLGIVRGHGGALKVYSEPGQGTSFKVLFPVAAADEDSPDEQRAGQGAVLVVDDEEIVRQVASEVLAVAGWAVVTADNGSEAVRVLEERGTEIGAVLLDLTMPGQSAEETVARLRALRPELAIVLTSGYSEQILGKRLAGVRIDGFIQKPYAAGALTELVDSVLSA